MNTQSTAVRLNILQNGHKEEGDEEGKEEVSYISVTDEPLNQDAALWRSIENALQTTSHLSMQTHPHLLKPINAEFLTGVPVKIKEGKAGVLTLYREDGEAYEDREILIAKVFAEKIELFTQTATAYRSASEAYRSTVQLLVEMMDAREAQTMGHSNRVMFWALSVGKIIGLSKEDMETLKWASLFHDVGMCGIEESVQKTKGRLGDDQMARIRQHPKLGAVICDPLHLPHPISPAILTHHERWDGRGYPDGVKGEKIPLLGRILALAEIFNAFVSPRNYRSPLPLEEAVKRIRDESGAALDPAIVDAFLLALKSDPVFNILKRG
jgi:putative nucleotidyltransferase with HDIG domain